MTTSAYRACRQMKNWSEPAEANKKETEAGRRLTLTTRIVAWCPRTFHGHWGCGHSLTVDWGEQAMERRSGLLDIRKDTLGHHQYDGRRIFMAEPLHPTLWMWVVTLIQLEGFHSDLLTEVRVHLQGRRNYGISSRGSYRIWRQTRSTTNCMVTRSDNYQLV